MIRSRRTTEAEAKASLDFTAIVQSFEPQLKRSLCIGFGIGRGLEATAESLACGWEHRDRITPMDNPDGYLYRVGIFRTEFRRSPWPVFPTVPEIYPVSEGS